MCRDRVLRERHEPTLLTNTICDLAISRRSLSVARTFRTTSEPSVTPRFLQDTLVQPPIFGATDWPKPFTLSRVRVVGQCFY
jgi:hypothetical protein